MSVRSTAFIPAVFKNLTFWVLIAIISGVLVGHFTPETGKGMKVVGDIFISIVKVFIAPIIFLTIVLGIGGMGDLRKVGRIGLKALLYFEVVTTFALGIGVAAAIIIRPGHISRAGLDINDASDYTSKAQQAFDWWEFFKTNITLQALILAIIVGIALNYFSQRERIVATLYKISGFVFKLLKLIMWLAPVGAFGGMAYTVGKFGLQSLLPLGKLMLTMYLTMAIFIFLILGAILRFYKIRIMDLIRYLKPELLIVLGTSSSEPALPNLIHKLERMGCSKPVVGLVVPTGYSFNLDGTSIYLSMSVIFLAQLYDVHLSFTQILTIVGLLMITSKGAAGVTGSGFVILASTMTAIHSIPMEGLGFIIGIDKFMSEARAVTNFMGNAVATIAISKNEGDFVDREHSLNIE
ncbi:cation:dicarboxylate symporter family transporter [Flavobacterium pallidum]|uniref:Glutamate/aspartate:proton symporter GltP n=1 Tax=Flavobacterium pallidum TaxID=2172098 RepID=A0A2S1SGT3_9FLAO|nr:cation:dicarboxylase symporter family transporter [Flavobacterium pallidum]AWI25626.1 glutamate/aspartate:proton symporter GltP [Flavobacterium pallidum]